MTLSEFLSQHELIQNVYDININKDELNQRFLSRYAKRKLREDLTVQEIQNAAQNVIDINREFLKNLFASALNPFVTMREKSITNEIGNANKTIDFANKSIEDTDEKTTYTGGGNVTTTDTGTIKNEGKGSGNATNIGYVNAFNNSDPSATNKDTNENETSANNTETRNTTNTQTRAINDTTNRSNDVTKNDSGNSTEKNDDTRNINFEHEQYTFDDYEKTIKRRINAYDFLVNLISDEVLELVYRMGEF